MIAIGNNKGGIGKTTTAANLATGLVRRGRRVLAIDNDPQGHIRRVMISSVQWQSLATALIQTMMSALLGFLKM